MIQVGARNMQNYPLLSEIGRSGKPTLIKRGLSSTLEELLMAAEYILKEGNPNVLLCERGIRTFETAYRFTLDLTAVPVLKELSHLPVIVDPSHAAGRRSLVTPLSLAAAAAGADGIIVEVHPQPEEAICDGPQQLYADDFAEYLAARRAGGRGGRQGALLDARLGGPTLAYLGPEGSFTHQAALDVARDGDELSPAPTAVDVVRAVASGAAGGGVVAFENSLEGSVSENLDEIMGSPGAVLAGERVLPVSFALLRAPGDDAELTAVTSHPFALAQCSAFIRGAGHRGDRGAQHGGRRARPRRARASARWRR